MKILQLTAENVKRLSVVSISPDGNLVEIAGKNAQGKTSVLDSIYMALGGSKAVPSKPIRAGKKKARIEITLGDGEKVGLVVERTFTESGTYLTVKTEDGAKYPKPQEMLADLLGALTFDPLSFMRDKPADQFETLRGLVKLDVDLDDMARERQEAYDERTEINRRIKTLRARIEAMPILHPATATDTKSIIERLSKVDEFNTEVRQAKAVVDRARARVSAASGRVEDARRAVAAAIAEEKAAAEELAALESREIPQLINPEQIKQELATAEELNKRAAAYNARESLVSELAAEIHAEEDLTEVINGIAERRRAAIAKAEMPVPGLTLGDDEVLFNGLPIGQASDAEQLKVSTAIAAALNPKLRIIRIRDGSLLDEDAMRWLAGFADASDMQIWIERVGEGGPGAIIMEDGHVKGVEPPEDGEEGADDQ